VLVVDPAVAQPAWFASASEVLGCACHHASSKGDALRMLSEQGFDAAVVNTELPDGSGFDVLDAIRDHKTTSGVIMTSNNATVELAVESVRRGACDFIPTPINANDLNERLGAALRKVRADRKRERKIERLQTICRRLNKARREVSDQVDDLCSDLVVAYQELADQVGHVTLASEFGATVRQELDIESLLRTVLESMLAKTGPTNAAVFLPTGHSDFNLGAYVNQTLSSESVDMLLDHLADVVPGEFEEEEAILRINEDADRWAWLTEEAGWLASSNTVVFSCLHDDECFAVVLLFRSEDQPFTDEILMQLSVMRELFAEQLDRVDRKSVV